MKRTLILLTILICVSPFQILKASLEDIKLNSEYAAVVEVNTGNVLIDKKKDVEAYPASITKVLTAILLVENVEEDSWIVASTESIKEEPSNSQFLLKEGEKIKRDDALRLIMMISSNDVSVAIAEHISGDVKSFSELMNDRAVELGAKNTNFVNPNGLPNENHRTTAYDMAMIGRILIDYPEILAAMKEEKFILQTDQRELEIKRTNKIFENNPSAIGGKTGWTKSSGNTLLEVIEKDGKQIVAVIMSAKGSELAYEDMNVITSKVLDLFETKLLFNQGSKVATVNTSGVDIQLLSKHNIEVVSFGADDKIENKKIVMKEKGKYEKGEEVARLEFELGGKRYTHPLITNQALNVLSKDQIETIEKENLEGKKRQKKHNLFIVLGTVIGTPLFLFLGYHLIIRRWKNKYTDLID